MTDPQLLFIHGLEGHPNGSKVRKLRDQGFDVRAENMHMSLTQLRKRNSAARNVLRLTEVRAGFSFFAVVMVVSIALRLPLLSAVTLVVLAWLFVRRRALLAAALHWSFIVIFHDPADDVVPHADSVSLAEGCAIDLRTVDAGGHRLLELLDRGELAEVIRDVTR